MYVYISYIGFVKPLRSFLLITLMTLYHNSIKLWYHLNDHNAYKKWFDTFTSLGARKKEQKHFSRQ